MTYLRYRMIFRSPPTSGYCGRLVRRAPSRCRTIEISAVSSGLHLAKETHLVNLSAVGDGEDDEDDEDNDDEDEEEEEEEEVVVVEYEADLSGALFELSAIYDTGVSTLVVKSDIILALTIQHTNTNTNTNATPLLNY